ncbi:hypothetical protein E4U33_004084 [Claviceps sp. LM78 group G4]|nr:hypothetical protein E4U33_004084 [Claviceps sp. LM78 group G4]
MSTSTCRIETWDITSSERKTPNHEHQLKPRSSASICAQDYTLQSRPSRVYPELRCSGPTSNMPVPFEALLPYAIMIDVWRYRNGLVIYQDVAQRGKSATLVAGSMGQMMERDRRLTGTMRGQIANPEAPPGFELSNGWKMEKRIC